MPKYEWEQLELTPITPKHTNAMGKTIVGNMLMLQTLEFNEDPGERRQGATMHSHPEEQFFIVKSGTILMREEGINAEGEWTVLKPGDAYHIPPDTMHEMIVQDNGSFYQFKIRIPGHSVFDGGWMGNAQEEWEEIKTLYAKSRAEHKESAPWLKYE